MAAEAQQKGTVLEEDGSRSTAVPFVPFVPTAQVLERKDQQLQRALVVVHAGLQRH